MKKPEMFIEKAEYGIIKESMKEKLARDPLRDDNSPSNAWNRIKISKIDSAEEVLTRNTKHWFTKEVKT